MISTDFLIVGQGIAGTLCAHELENRDKSFAIVDSGAHNASKACAGMVNPVVLKRFSPVWQGTKQIVQARTVFEQLEKKLGTKLDYQFDLLKIFNNQQDRNTWSLKSETEDLNHLLSQLHEDASKHINEAIRAPFGYGNVNLCGRMDIPTLLSLYRNNLIQQKKLISEEFDYNALKITEKHVTYKNIQAQNIIFCEGFGIKNNPYFNYLPLNGNKGESLVVKIPNLEMLSALKAAVIVMPLQNMGNNIFYIGATYNWTDKDTQPSTVAKEELLEKLHTILSPDMYKALTIIEHKVAIRPTVSDRRPLLGQHHKHKQCYILNGLGTRGVMLGCSMAPMLIEHILNGAALLPEVNIQRFSELTH